MSDDEWVIYTERKPECADRELFLVDFGGCVGFAYYEPRGVFLDEPYGMRVFVYAWRTLPDPCMR